jgi:hypothetical protein
VGDGKFHVVKRQLVRVLQMLLGTNRLDIRPQNALAEVLKREARTFTVRITPAGNEKYESGWRERVHDELVLAMALACWAAEHPPRWPPAPDSEPQVLRP